MYVPIRYTQETVYREIRCRVNSLIGNLFKEFFGCVHCKMVWVIRITGRVLQWQIALLPYEQSPVHISCPSSRAFSQVGSDLPPLTNTETWHISRWSPVEIRGRGCLPSYEFTMLRRFPPHLGLRQSPKRRSLSVIGVNFLPQEKNFKASSWHSWEQKLDRKSYKSEK